MTTETTLRKLEPMPTKRAAEQLHRLSDSLAESATRDETRAALLAVVTLDAKLESVQDSLAHELGGRLDEADIRDFLYSQGLPSTGRIGQTVRDALAAATRRAEAAERDAASVRNHHRALLDGVCDERDAAVARAEAAEASSARFAELADGHAADKSQLVENLRAMRARAEAAEAELARVQRLPELPWAEVTAPIMQSLAMLSRAGDKATAQRLLDVLDKGKTYVARLLARAEAAEQQRDAVFKAADDAAAAVTAERAAHDAAFVALREELEAMRVQRDEAKAEAEKYLANVEERQSELGTLVDAMVVRCEQLAQAQADSDQLAAQLREATTNVERSAAECVALREALRDALRVLGPRSEEQSYGHFYGGDPRNFSPDEECSTEGEREAHRLACEAAERDEKARDLPAAHQATTPEEAKRLMKGGEAVSAMIGPVAAHVHLRGFGLGVTAFRDEEIGGVFDSLAAALATSAPESDAFAAGVRRAAMEEAAQMLDSVPGFSCGVEGGRWLTEMAKDIRARSLAPAPTKTETNAEDITTDCWVRSPTKTGAAK